MCPLRPGRALRVPTKVPQGQLMLLAAEREAPAMRAEAPPAVAA